MIKDIKYMYDDQNSSYPFYHNETIVIDGGVTQFLFYLLAVSLLSISVISACCRGAPSIMSKINNIRNTTHLTDYILQEETEEVDLSTETCSICIEPYLIKQKILILSCDHKFHSHCIKEWFEKELTCPICRQSLQLN